MNNRGKRSLESEEEQPERKRPALASVIVEALKVDSLQKLCSSLEPILRRVVSEEVERALAKLGPPRLNGRASPKRIEGPDGRNLQLQFRSHLSLPLFTGGKVEGEQGAAIHVVLSDANTGHVVTFGPEASVKLDVVVLEGDFNTEEDEGWTQEEFESHVVKEREGRRPLLTGDLQVTLKEGVGTLGELTFTDNSSWIRSRKFRLGLKVASGFCEGIRIREAKTKAFTVKDHRGELYKKHYPPALNDEVWRLEKIGKDGSFHKRLNNHGIFIVQDFLRLVVRDQQKLRNILGSGMSNKMWDALLEHAKTCVLSGKLYVYHPEDNQSVGIVFNNIYELSGLITGDQYHSSDSLTDSQKFYVDTLVKKAYENWNEVLEYDGKMLMNFKQVRRSARNDPQIGALDYTNTIDDQMLPKLPIPFSSEQPPADSSLPLEVYNEDMNMRYSTQAQLVSSSPQSHMEGISYLPQDKLMNAPNSLQSSRMESSMGLALGPPQLSGFENPANLNPFDNWSGNRNRTDMEFLTEDEIRTRSHEMLENEEMQHLLRLFNTGGQASINIPVDGFGFPNYAPSPLPFDEDRARPGKAVVGWLKIKAAMRWGFFIRKKAAERRAQIVELED
ncbi:hypothetical protein SAY86_027280 [Trapa natans]|uniref:Calmodulin-binding protein n=1 Tax=Trapa natans TaxID=22666 RepID=A0AAN7QM02_TRANT|nr:hypothetical protein SAY86_027280 [Trapa natans]